MEEVILDIAGMRCCTCAIGIELALGKKIGVNDAKVSSSERIAIVKYDAASLKISDITKTINDLGYIATLRN